MPINLLTEDEIANGLAGLHPDWSGSTEKLARSIAFADFLTAVEFISRLAPRCEEMDHHADLDLRWRRVDVVRTTHFKGGVTQNDLKLAAIVDEVAGGLPQHEG